MIKIIHLITSLGVGGAEQQLFRILNHMDKNRFENIIISIQDEGILGRELKALGFKLYTLNISRNFSALKGMIKLIHILQTERPDILQTWLYHADFFGLLASKFSKVPKLAWNVRCSYIGMQYYSLTSALIIRLCTWFSNQPDAIVVNSERGMVSHRQLGYRSFAWHCIPNGFDLEMFRPNELMRAKLRNSLNIEERDLLVGLVGRFDPFKDHSTFFKAAALVSRQISNAKFVLVGLGTDPSNQFLISESKKYGVFDKTLFLGVRRDIPDIMAALDAFVLTSASEGFPNVLCEAMACGIPCVSTDAGDARKILGETGHVVAPGDANALAVALINLLTLDEEDRRQLGATARNRIAEHYSLKKITSIYEALYQNLCSGGKFECVV